MIRIAAVGDVHFAEDARGTLRPYLEQLPEQADVLLIAGDLTRHGEADEAAVFADELRGLDLPVISVLGNHDYHLEEEKRIREVMEDAGVIVLDGESCTLRIGDASLAVVGTKGFGGGFPGAGGSDFGEPEMKAFIRHTMDIADRLGEALRAVSADRRVVLLHYSPIEATLVGERLEIYPFLGSYLLGEAVDRVGADVAIHGHAHGGTEKGFTPGGIQVRNVAQPVISRAYNVYCLDCEAEPAG